MNNKKWLIALPIVMLVISSCAMSSNEIALEFNDQLTYSWDTLSIDDVSSFDLMSFVVNDYDDYQLAIATLVSPEDYPDGLVELLDKLEIIGETATQTLDLLVGLSSSQLNDLCETHAITLTIDDIVRFNDFKAFTASQTDDVRLEKQAIIEARIDRPLTSQEVIGFDSIQTYLNYIHNNYHTIPYPLNTVTYQTFEDYLVSRSYTLTTETKAAMEAAFDVFELVDQD